MDTWTRIVELQKEIEKLKEENSRFRECLMKFADRKNMLGAAGDAKSFGSHGALVMASQVIQISEQVLEGKRIGDTKVTL